MTEGGIASWKKKEGEAFTAGDVLLEIETDKATMDVEAQDDGVLGKILVQDGSKGIQVGTTIAILGEEGDDFSGADALAGEDSGPSSSSSSSPSPPEQEPVSSEESSANKSRTTSAAQSSGTTAALATPADQTKFGSGGGGTDAAKDPIKEHGGDKPKFFASPLAKKLALERGVPLGSVKGTGPEGRIVKVRLGFASPAHSFERPRLTCETHHRHLRPGRH